MYERVNLVKLSIIIDQNIYFLPMTIRPTAFSTQKIAVYKIYVRIVCIYVFMNNWGFHL